MKLLSIPRTTSSLISAIIPAIFLLSSLAAAGQTSTDIQVTNTAIQPTVHRLGVNLGDQGYWDSGQIMKNLIFENPGFEGLKYRSIFKCRAGGTANTCQDDNQYNGQPANFWAGAPYLILSGAQAGQSGTMISNTAPGTCSGCGPTFTFDKNLSLAANDYFAITNYYPGNGDAAWAMTTGGGGTITTELNDLSPNTPGKQAMLMSASGSGQTASLTQGFDTWSNLSFIQMNGNFEVTFRAKGMGGSNVLNVTCRRLQPGLGAYLSQNVTLTNSWQDYKLTFKASENGTAVGPVQLVFLASGSNLELDDVSLDQTDSDPSNTTVFRDDVVNALKELHPGTIRMMAAGAALGSDLPNQLQVPFARYREGFNADGASYPNIAYGIHEFLELCQTVGADPWLTIPTATTPAEMKAFIQYLTGTGGDSWSALRISRGQNAPWTSVFNKIHIELGNETWNGSFKGESMNYPGYPQWANVVFGAARQAPGFDASKFNLILSGLAATPGYNQPMLSFSTQHDSFDIAPYLLFSANNESQSLMFGAMFAEPEIMESSAGEVYKNLTVGSIMPSATSKTTGVSVYETNLGTMIGNITQAQLDQLAPSIGAGLAHTEHMLQMMRIGIQYQNTFSLPQYKYRRGDGSLVRLWGIVVDMGTTNRKRPQFQTQAMANAVIGGSMMQTVHTGANPTWDQPLSSDSVVLNGAHELQSFAFVNQGQTSTIIFNLSQTTALPVTFSGANAPSGNVEMTQITSANITDNNETADVVEPTTQTLSGFNPATGLKLPPFSMTVLTATTGGVQAPVFSVPGGTYTVAQKVSITDTTPGATIYYTADGSTPTTSSAAYAGAISVTGNETIEAIAVVAGQTPSAVSTASYVIVAPTVATPTFSLAGGSYAGTQSLTISDSTAGAAIYYTTNGSAPTTASTQYTGAIQISASETVKAIASATGYTDSAVASAAYSINSAAAATPVLSLDGGSYTGTQSLTISDSTAGASIYYTTNGSTPTTASTKYVGAIQITASETVKAIASATGFSNSAVASADYVIITPAPQPVFSLSTGTYSGTQTLTITDAVTGATIYYTTNGATPTTSSTRYTGPIQVTETETVMAIAVATNHTASPVASAAFKIVLLPAAAPVFSLASGSYNGAQSLTITNATAGASIYYTTNGTTPTTSSTQYSAPITISGNYTVTAVAKAPNYNTSIPTAATYTITHYAPASMPKFSLAAGKYAGAQTVTLSSGTAGATIYYTSNGAAPTTSSAKYAGPIKIAASSTVKAIATATNYVASGVATAAYTIGPAETDSPLFSLPGGTYTGTQTLALAASTAGSTIYYTINGATPTTSSTKYTAPIKIATSETVKALAVSSTAVASPVVTAIYKIEAALVATPAFSVAAGTYKSIQTVTLSDVTPGATIYYTTNGATPTTASTKYTAGIKIAATTTVKAIASTATTSSAIASATYTIVLPSTATPTFSIAAGSYVGTQTLKIADATAGAVIYYTTNGSTPTTASTKYTGAITISATETIKTLATSADYGQSAVASATYTINKPMAATPVFSLAGGTYAGTQTLAISDTTAGASIYFTTNGVVPTTASAKYLAPFKITASMKVEAIAVATNYNTSAVAIANYTINPPMTATPTFSLKPGAYFGWQTISLSDATAGATIYYTISGPAPTIHSNLYKGPIQLKDTETIQAIATATNYQQSAVASGKYTITEPTVATPSFSLATGAYIGTKTVGITDSLAGATIYYTTNGSAPTTSSTKYTGAITISATQTLKAIAAAPFYNPSAVASATFTIMQPTTATPKIVLAAGTYTGPQSVTITDSTAGASIYYTTNGTTPTVGSPKYTGPITVTTSQKVMAIASVAKYYPSAVAAAQYTIIAPKAAAPKFSIGTGTYTTVQTVTLTDVTAGATISYKINGGPATKYTAPIKVSGNVTIAATATATGYSVSTATTATFTIKLPTT